MNKISKFKIVLIICFLSSINFSIYAQSFNFLKAGEVMPQGWMKEQIRLDLKEGYLTKFDNINHTVTHNLFVNKDRKSGGKFDDLQCWWSGEHEGYWKDAVLRMAFLSDNKEQILRATQWIDEIVASQTPDGYIGIYGDGNQANYRYNHKGENGELWTQSRIFQALIAGYEFTANQKWLQALKKAVDNTLKNDPGNYFNPENKNFGGVSHGIGFFDTLWYLHTKTAEKKYADFAVKLYNDFNNSSIRDDDLKIDKLLSENKYEIVATNSKGWDYKLPSNALFTPILEGGDRLHPFEKSPIKLKGELVDSIGNTVTVSLVPIGSTVLRRTTFPSN